MADPVDAEHTPSQQPEAQVLRVRRIERDVREYAERRKRRLIAPFGAQTAAPPSSTVTPRTVLQSDFLNVGAHVDGIEILIERNSDAAMRFWFECSAAFQSFVSMEPNPGEMAYFDGSSWVRIANPGVASVLLHDGTSPFWSPI